MAEAQPGLAGIGKGEAQECFEQLTAQQAEKKEPAAALDAARDLRRCGRVRSRAAQAENKNALAA